jgi:mycoredoxin
MITIYGSSWCDDTRRTLRHLRRLAVPHRYLDIDDDLDALERALALTGGRRRTPIVDLGLSGSPLVEPDNETLTGALVEMSMLTTDQARDRMEIQNIGDLERVTRTLAGVALVAGAAAAPRLVRGVAAVVGGYLALTGVIGWCPGYHYAGVTSLGGPGDRPDETLRDAWIVPRDPLAASAREPLKEPAP